MKAVFLSLLLTACAIERPKVLDDPEGGFFDSPFPSAARTLDNGAPDYSGFPNRSESGLIDRYLELTQNLDGMSTVAPIFFRFDGPIDVKQLPSPAESLSADASLMLLDMDSQSAHYGKRLPIQVEWQEEETAHQPKHLLSLAPVYGMPMRPSTQYLALVRDSIAEVPEELTRSLLQAPDDSELGAVRALLQWVGVPLDEVASFTFFTTQDTLSELAYYAWWTRNNLPYPALDQELRYVEKDRKFYLYRGSMEVPLFQEGEKPYSTSGGVFAKGHNGQPKVHQWESITFSLTIPSTMDMPEDGWPVMIYSHGTGGSYKSCCRTKDPLGPAKQMAKRGIATFSISQPLHADRSVPGTEESLHTFNYLNPDSARHNFRQGALDIVYQAALLSSQPHRFTHEDNSFVLDPDKMVFMGHSQGGMTGALAGPFVGDQIKAMVFSGTGGGMSITLTQRKDVVDIEALIREMLQFDPDEELTELHPVSGLIQILTDITDPLNYGRYWFREVHDLASTPVPVLLTEGLLDEQTPSRTSEALGAVAGLPILDPVAHVSTAHDLMGLEFQSMPTSSNLIDWAGDPITGGLAQYAERDHFAVFDSNSAAKLVYDFLASALEDKASLGQH